MSERLVHRGPDEKGVFDAPHIALAVRRLNIIGLDGGSQPLTSEDGDIVMIFNGEIYNHIELRQSLKASGYQFLGTSDGEVIVALYRRHGLAFVEHLRGMFAIALWDAKLNRLVLVRDRMGEKPLYYTQRDGQILFASEMKAILGSGLVPFTLDPAAVHLYFHFQYVPEPLTAVRGVSKLDAGHMLIIDTAPWRVRQHCYWRLSDAPALEGDAASLIRERLEDAAALSIRADVPTGTALSGGLDSSVVAALTARLPAGPVTAITIGYEGTPDCDERAVARDLAKGLGLEFAEVELADKDMVEAFPTLNRWRDDPIADIAGYGYFAVMQRAHQLGLKVMLQGHGGDELFWGYTELRAARARYVRRRTLSARPWARWFNGRSDSYSMYQEAPDFRMAAASIAQYCTPQFVEAVRGIDPSAQFTLSDDHPDFDVTLTEQVCASYLRSNGIAQSERLGMASSVELRLPYMDHLLIETIIGLRKHHTDADLPEKAWLKAAVADIVPAAVLDRPKRGFAPPVRRWHKAIFAAHGSSIIDGNLVEAGVLSDRGARKAARGAFPARAIAPLSFKILVLEQWCRQMQAIAQDAAVKR